MAKPGTEWFFLKEPAKLSVESDAVLKLVEDYVKEENLPYRCYKTAKDSRALIASPDAILGALDTAGFGGTVRMSDSPLFGVLLNIKPTDKIDSLFEELSKEPDKVGVSFVVGIVRARRAELDLSQTLDNEWSYDPLGRLTRHEKSAGATEVFFYSVNRKVDLEQLRKGPARKIGERPDNLAGRSGWFNKRHGPTK